MELDHEIEVRLRRIEGQIAGIRRMHEQGRYCADVLDQLAAARAALEAVGFLLLERHVDGCVRDALESATGSERAAELVSVVRRFVKSA
jgi:DNA-binding FrmR family transcriptional regulator